MPSIAVVGAAGLIGQAVASDLMRAGFPIVAIARRFTAVQKNEFAQWAVECPIAALDAQALAQLLARPASYKKPHRTQIRRAGLDMRPAKP